jgi:hypothetical protein
MHSIKTAYSIYSQLPSNLDAVSSICNLRTCHTIVRDPPNMEESLATQRKALVQKVMPRDLQLREPASENYATNKNELIFRNM